MTELEPRLSDEAAQKVLARALELQAEGAGALTVSQIREIAADLAIPASAVDQALSEYRAAAASPPGTASASLGRRQGARVLMLSMGLVGTVTVLLILGSFLFRL